ncbi:hypothetical protein K470DRAFT_249021 [Piedraia hortae CBS 480.64]|uniref:Vacuolar protein sorting-associated protein 51 homolog n=1 Tax=Piedraia hortae CBS 480.64 TaxID=1314780 RepID=A0A6A7BWH0_9PEZI|nr:hypothetical protein K470DRAFT_249021 [Piedraia hortae CBS 480.64]
MSAIDSPRSSLTFSSRRNSLSPDVSSSRPRPAASSRRNRAALRDYYGLSGAASAESPVEVPSEKLESEMTITDPETYVQTLLAHESLEGILRIEARSINDIRMLDGEKKALVYDNYSKLITATETIRKMREKMDPATETQRLASDIKRIAEAAAELSNEMGRRQSDGNTSKRQQQQQVAQWVLDAPQRLQNMMSEGKSKQAHAEWERVSSLLERWKLVKGVEQTRSACLEAMGQSL